jgi:hypothetical protein
MKLSVESGSHLRPLLLYLLSLLGKQSCVLPQQLVGVRDENPNAIERRIKSPADAAQQSALLRLFEAAVAADTMIEGGFFSRRVGLQNVYDFVPALACLIVFG